jgi:hypothetical protein
MYFFFFLLLFQVLPIEFSNALNKRDRRQIIVSVSEIPLSKTFHPDTKGGQTAILVRWSAAQRTTEMLADQRQRTTEIELPLVRC